MTLEQLRSLGVSVTLSSNGKVRVDPWSALTNDQQQAVTNNIELIRLQLRDEQAPKVRVFRTGEVNGNRNVSPIIVTRKSDQPLPPIISPVTGNIVKSQSLLKQFAWARILGDL